MLKQRIVNTLVLMVILFSGLNLVASSCNMANKEEQGSNKEKTIFEVIKRGALLVDVRTPEEFSTGHVSGSINIPLVSVQDSIDVFKDKGDIVVFCQSGGRSSRALNILKNNGVSNVYNGGGWESVKALVKKIE